MTTTTWSSSGVGAVVLDWSPAPEPLDHTPTQSQHEMSSLPLEDERAPSPEASALCKEPDHGDTPNMAHLPNAGPRPLPDPSKTTPVRRDPSTPSEGPSSNDSAVEGPARVATVAAVAATGTLVGRAICGAIPHPAVKAATPLCGLAFGTLAGIATGVYMDSKETGTLTADHLLTDAATGFVSSAVLTGVPWLIRR